MIEKNPPSNYENEMDLRELVKILLEYKKTIISTLLVFIIASILFLLTLKPSFISSAILEITYYEIPGENRELVAQPSDLISELEILLLKKNTASGLSQEVSFKSFENKIIIMETTSGSTEENEDILTEMISYIYDRHSNLTISRKNQKKHQISNQIDLIESEISFLKEKMQLDLEKMQLALEGNISKLQSNLPIIDQEISQLEQVVTQDINNLNLLKGSPLAIERASNSPTLEQIISNYKSQINQLKRERNRSNADLGLLSKQLDGLDKENFQSDELFSLEKRLKALENQLQTLISRTIVIPQPIKNIETEIIKPNTLLIVFLGITIGFITGILLVLIRNFVKSFRESEA